MIRRKWSTQIIWVPGSFHSIIRRKWSTQIIWVPGSLHSIIRRMGSTQIIWVPGSFHSIIRRKWSTQIIWVPGSLHSIIRRMGSTQIIWVPGSLHSIIVLRYDNDPSPAQLIPTIVSLSHHNSSANVHDHRGVGRHNVRNLIYVSLTALSHIYTVITEVVCPSRKSTVCSSPCTYINNMSMSTSAKLPSKAMKTSKHHRKVLKK
jgi:hypothetical protein